MPPHRPRGTTIPSTAGTYTDFFYGLISTTQVDTTYNTSDDAEATTSVTVSSQQSTTISISNLPGSGTYGGSFTPSYAYIGDGTPSVSSNSTSICTVTSGVVHYVGVGTCSLTAHATAGTLYLAATGTPQTFSVGQATPSETYRHFVAHVKAQYAAGRRTVLVIDEAQNLGIPGLEELRVLSN